MAAASRDRRRHARIRLPAQEDDRPPQTLEERSSTE
jgi:hypothetical protein